MRRRSRPIALGAAAVLLALPLAGCGDDDDASAGDTTTSTDPTTTTTAGGGQEATVTVTEPGPVSLAVGETVAIELSANPTTGYQWEPTTEPDEAVVRIVSDTYTAEPTDRVGSGGTQVIVVEGVAPGAATLDLGYSRPWEEGVPPAETATFDITVT